MSGLSGGGAGTPHRNPLAAASAQRAPAQPRRRLDPGAMAQVEPVGENVTADAAVAQAAEAEPAPARSRRRVSAENRKPFGSQEQKLAFPGRPGYHRHWFNDEPGRIMRAEEAGYVLVTDAVGKGVSTVVGIGRGGSALTAYLMEIPIEWYLEDMAAKDEAVEARLTQIKSGEYERPEGRDGKLRYAGSTKGDIAIQAGNRR